VRIAAGKLSISSENQYSNSTLDSQSTSNSQTKKVPPQTTLPTSFEQGPSQLSYLKMRYEQ